MRFERRAELPARARKFLRVSTGKQDEQKQVADVIGHIQAQGYEDDGRDYLAHGKSAYKGKHLPLLLEAIRDMADGQYDVLVLWDSSRFTRMGAESIFSLMAKAREAGGRIEFAAPHALALNVASDWTPVMLALQATADKLESDRKRQQTLSGISRRQEAGSVHGKAAWGYEIAGEKEAKRFIPTAQGREWVPRLYRLAIEGKGCNQLAQLLTDARVEGKRWSEARVNHLLRNPVYYGERRAGGNLETEGLVDLATWQEAMAAIEGQRQGGGRGPTVNPPSYLRPVCARCFGESREGNASGRSAMYRIRYPDNWMAYRCSGSGPLRKGCGARLVPADVLDFMALDWYSRSAQLHMERVFIPGSDPAAELRDLNRQIAEAAARGDYAQVGALSEKAAGAAQAEGQRSRWELRETGLTMGKWFRGQSRDEQRAWLANELILAERLPDGTVLGGEAIRDDDGKAVGISWWNWPALP
jgi:DNA invertase Pin-like site-specific DNA recombinase